MKNNRFLNGIILTGALAAALFCQCSTSTVSGVETTNGNTSLAKLPAGTPAANARVLFIDHSAWATSASHGETAVVESTTTDSQGKFFVAEKYYRDFNIQIDARDAGLLLRRYEPESPQLPGVIDTAALMPYISVSGTAVAQGGSATAVLLAGSAYRAIVNQTSGTFTFAKVPSAPMDLYLSVKQLSDTVLAYAKFVVPPSQSTSIVEALSAVTGRVLVDDFSKSAWWATSLSAVTGGGNWYPYSDNDSAVVDAVSDAAAASGLVLRLDAIIKKDVPNYYAGCGFHLGNPYDSATMYFNISKMTSFEFRARSSVSRQIVVVFGTRALAINPGTQASAFMYTVDVDTGWTTFTVPADSIRPVDSITWQQAATAVNKIQFGIVPTATAIPDTTTLWLGDLYFNGMNAEDLF